MSNKSDMKKIFFPVLIALVAAGCTPKQSSIPEEWPWEDPTPVVTPSEDASESPSEDPSEDPSDEPAAPGWAEVKDGSFGELPEGIRLYHATNLLDRQAEAWLATVDLTQQEFHVWGLNDPKLSGTKEPFQTPEKVYNAQGKPVLVMNGGFFYADGGTYYTASLAVENGKLLSPNINYASLDWVTMYYPTKAGFIRHKDGSMEAAWTYWVNASQHYIYQIPAENGYGKTPLKQPSSTFPEKGVKFEAQTAIGAGPVLLKNGEIKDTYTFECLQADRDVNCANPDPRTAIGATEDGLLVLFVCEGRNMTEGVKGYSTGEVAQILKDFGCKEAVNLDGGGSTCLLVNGKETLKPSDGHQRAVGSCVYIK